MLLPRPILPQGDDKMRYDRIILTALWLLTFPAAYRAVKFYRNGLW